MYYMNHDAVDYFRVDFTPDESIVGGKYYPLGTFAAEALECGLNVSEEIHRSLKRFQEEFWTAAPKVWGEMDGDHELYDFLKVYSNSFDNFI